MAATTKISRWEIRRGRQDELEKTGTGEATIFVNDVEGLYDPSNTGSPYFGNLDGAQVAITLRNPITDTYHTRFRGNIEEYGYDLHESQVKTEVAINCVDLFDYLSTNEMVPGEHGFLPVPADVQASAIFYEDGDIQLAFDALALDAGLPPDLCTFFTGNVNVQERIYDAGYSFLAAMQDLADAEFPGVANIYVSREGKVTFHGRHARFDPDGVSAGAGAAWDFHRWNAGDGAALLANPGASPPYAQLRPPFHSDRSMKMVINSALITPLDIAEDEVAGCNITDTASITKYGTRSYTAQDIRILEHKTNGNTGVQECQEMGEYYVTNYSEPRTRPRQLTFRSLPPEDPRAPAVWDLMCRVDISDIVYLEVTNPGGGGFAEEFYVEGITQSAEPSSADYDIVETILDVSPQAYYATDVFND